MRADAEAEGSQNTDSHYTGIYSFIVAVLYLKEDVTETMMDTILQRMRIAEQTPIDTIEGVLKRMIKDGYIVKNKDAANGEEEIYYSVGPRARIEIGEDGVADLIRTVWGEAGGEDLEKKLEHSFALTRKREVPIVKSEPKSRPGRRRRSGRAAPDDDDDEGAMDEDDD